MDRDDNRKMDEGLQGNEKIEQAIRELQQTPSGEELAHTLTVGRCSAAGSHSGNAGTYTDCNP